MPTARIGYLIGETPMSLLDFVLRLGAALLCGSLIGVERQFRQHEAGLRTSALVASGSALFVLIAGLSSTDTDPLRIAPQIVTGVGFLCAGVILRDGLHVRGLTTAGTLWCASGIGLLAGSGYYLAALAGSGFVLAANMLLRPLANFISLHSHVPSEAAVDYVLRITCLSQQERLLRSLMVQEIKGDSLSLQALQSRKDPQDNSRVDVTARIQAEGHQDALIEQIVARLCLEEGVSEVRWEIAADEEERRSTVLTSSSTGQAKEPKG